MFIIFILYHILYIIFQIKKQKNQFISLPIEEGDFLIRLLNNKKSSCYSSAFSSNSTVILPANTSSNAIPTGLTHLYSSNEVPSN